MNTLTLFKQLWYLEQKNEIEKLLKNLSSMSQPLNELYTLFVSIPHPSLENLWVIYENIISIQDIVKNKMQWSQLELFEKTQQKLRTLLLQEQEEHKKSEEEADNLLANL